MKAWLGLVSFIAAMWLTAALIVLAQGCATARPDAGQLVRGVNDVLGVLCATREALNGAREQLERGDVGAARDLLKAYLLEHGHDPEVAAVLQLLETQIDRVAWGF